METVSSRERKVLYYFPIISESIRAQSCESISSQLFVEYEHEIRMLNKHG